MQLVVLAVAAILANSASGGDTIRFKDKEALVSDTDGVPLFRGRRDFVLKLGHNPDGAVVAYDARSKRVRVSKAGTELWVACADLEPMVTSCSETAARPSRASALRGSEAEPGTLAADLPSCPGDARCPKLAE
jgi:hypothetical protein